ncbi:adenylate/guanylate cyclase domain-containing protein [Saccharospirillum salsuginis]|uniref:Protein CyaB n=1 Tax=Saccharospirillum salsuginis TaxID=418750 RepID=A0A918KKW3_9GAMM|nr:adenylate/guanylate cyclase domain-containing protein [Saccharospirillum salsuginis]GGX66795.1 protein CyaB [Saccharospirillum salsuginis]
MSKRPVAQKKKKPAKPPATPDLDLYDDFTVLPISAEFNSRSLIYLTLAGTLVSILYTGQISNLFTIIVAFCLLYPTLIRFLSMPLRQRYPKQVGYTLMLFDAFFIGAILVAMGSPLVPTLLLIIMANASFICVGRTSSYILCLLFLVLGGGVMYAIEPVAYLTESSTITNVIAAIGAGLHVATNAYYTAQQARYLKTTRQELHTQSQKYRALSQKLSKYLSPQVWETIFRGKRDVKLETQRKRLVIFFSDIKGFSEISEMMEAEALTELINTYLTEMSRVVMKYGGTIDKFIGDAIMVFFGDPESKGARQDTLACVSMAIEMRKLMRVLRQRWRAQGIQQPLEIRMGINSGYCTVGNFGAETRMDYTILGKEVNLASRLESSAEPGEILVSYDTYAQIKDKILCREKGHIKAKGFSRPVPIYQVVDFRRDLGAKHSFTELELEGFTLSLDMEKVRNYDRDRILSAIEKVKTSLNNKTP